MKTLAIALMLLFGASANGQVGNAPPTVERLCGKLQHYEEIPVKNAVNTFEDKTRKLAHVTVRLYRADTGHTCCNGLSVVAETKTGRWGSFQLKEKGISEGLYWLVVRPGLREYRLMVRYDPKKASQSLCSETFFDLDDAGNFWETKTLVVD